MDDEVNDKIKVIEAELNKTKVCRGKITEIGTWTI